MAIYGYSAITALRGLPNRRALAFEVGMDGESDAEVPLHEFGFKTAYRQSIARDWLVMETRLSLTWPREEREQPRKPSWGIGIGFEMFFGTDEFLARPVTFWRGSRQSALRRSVTRFCACVSLAWPTWRGASRSSQSLRVAHLCERSLLAEASSSALPSGR